MAFDNGLGETSLFYHPADTSGAGLLARETLPDGPSLEYGYDELNRLLSTQIEVVPGLPDAAYSEVLEYDALGRITSTGVANYQYVGDSRRQWQTLYPSGMRAESVYFSSLGDLRLSQLNHFITQNGNPNTLLTGNAYNYDAEGQITNWQRSGNETSQFSYTYDDIGRLIEASGTNVNYEYNYDGVGNREKVTINGVQSHAAYNDFNQLVEVRTNVTDIYNNDLEGNQTLRQSASHGNRRYVWDVENRLIAVEDPANQTTRSDFQYDALDRRIGIQDKVNGVLTGNVRLFYCGTTLCAKEDLLAGKTTRYYADGETQGAVGGQNRYYLRDHLGSVRAVSDDSGNLIATYSYDPYGNRTVLTGTAADSDFGYTGHYTHQATGLALAPYRAYDAGIGRWISRDPIGEAGGINLYSYVGGNPVNAVDPLGLDTVYIGGNVDLQTPVDIVNSVLGTDIIGNGGGAGVAVSFPGLNGGEFDIGGYISGTVGRGTGLGGKKYGASGNIELGYCAGSVSDLSGEGGQIGFNDGIGGLTLHLDENSNPVGAGVHLGPGYSIGANGSLTTTLSARRGLLY